MKNMMKRTAIERGERDGQKAWDTLISKALPSDREELVRDYVRGVIEALDDNMLESE